MTTVTGIKQKLKNMILNFLKRWIKSIFCKHKYKLSATGRYKGTIYGDIDVYYFECKKCFKEKDIVTYPTKTKKTVNFR